MKRIAVLLLAIGFAAGCTTLTSTRYSVSADNNQALKKFAGKKASVTAMTTGTEFHANCRLKGPIQAADGMSIPEFIQKAFNDEFKFADIYDAGKGRRLSGILNNIEFASADVMGGRWDIDLTLESDNGRSLRVNNRYIFKTGLDSAVACNQTAQALGAAVQDLIYKTVVDPKFGSLLQ